MKFRSTVILVIIAVLGVAAAVFVERRDGVARSGRLQPAVAFTPQELPVEAVARITLTRARAPTLVFQRTGTRWDQVEPFDYPMDAFSIHQLIATAAALESVPLRAPPGDDAAPEAAALGLDPPRGTIVFEWRDGALAVTLGRFALAGRAYLSVAGRDGPEVVTQELHDRALQMDPKEWRDRTIFRDVGIDSDRVEITSGESTVVLARDRKRWTMVAPVPTRVSGAARDELMQALGRARSSGFILDEPDDLARFGLSTPAGVVTVTTTRRVERAGEIVGVPEAQRLIVGARIGVGTQDRFGMVAGRPAVLRISEPVLKAIFRSPVDLADPTASGVVPMNIKRVQVRGPGGDFEIERDLERWVARDEDNREVPRERVNALLAAATEIRASKVLFQAFPTELEVATVTFFGFDQRPLDTVRIAREAGPEGGWALDNGDNVLRVLPASVQIPLTREAFGLGGNLVVEQP